MGYGEKQLDRGQIFELRNLANDEKLERLRYLDKLPSDASPVECGVCGEHFLDSNMRGAHGDLRHADRFAGMNEQERMAEEERLADEMERRLVQSAPLALENTTASRK